MKAEYINPFVSAFFNVLKQTAQVDGKRGQLALRTNFLSPYEVAVIIGLIGDLEGQVVYTMREDVAKNLASAMMMGFPVEELNDLARSAISEFANMVTGNAVILLGSKGLKINISPPTLVKGKDIEITFEIPMLSIPISTPLGDMEIDVALREKV